MTVLVEVVWLMLSYPFLACIVYILILPVCSSERPQGHSPVSSSDMVLLETQPRSASQGCMMT